MKLEFVIAHFFSLLCLAAAIGTAETNLAFASESNRSSHDQYVYLECPVGFGAVSQTFWSLCHDGKTTEDGFYKPFSRCLNCQRTTPLRGNKRVQNWNTEVCASRSEDAFNWMRDTYCKKCLFENQIFDEFAFGANFSISSKTVEEAAAKTTVHSYENGFARKKNNFRNAEENVELMCPHGSLMKELRSGRLLTKRERGGGLGLTCILCKSTVRLFSVCLSDPEIRYENRENCETEHFHFRFLSDEKLNSTVLKCGLRIDFQTG
jgi:hypothetical protein